MPERLPSLVIVGRPNVGKSTLFNRLTGTRRAIVTDEPGITRDRIYGKAEWHGRVVEVVDTGGIIPDDKALIPAEIFRQARVAIENAAMLVLVVDSSAGLTPLDQELARLLRTTGRPFVVAANKVDSRLQETNAATFHSLGVPVFPIAAEHGTGVDDLLDSALEQIKGHDIAVQAEEKKLIEIAIIGRPNVGKSTLLNRMAGEERSIVSPTPGTTMDSVDTDVVHQGRTYRFVDTAGIRRKGKTKLVAEKLSSVILVVNKWDLAAEAAQRAADEALKTAKGKAKRGENAGQARQEIDKGKLLFEYEHMVRDKFKFLSYAPILFLSAKTGERAQKLYPLIEQVAAARLRRIPTPELNRWLKEDVDLGRASNPKARPVRIYYITQAKIAPPVFLLFTNQKRPLHFGFERFLENRLRAKWDFLGTPVRFIQRLRKGSDSGKGV